MENCKNYLSQKIRIRQELQCETHIQEEEEEEHHLRMRRFVESEEEEVCRLILTFESRRLYLLE